MGSTSAAVFVSHAPKGSDCFERKIFKKGHKKLTFYKSSEIGNLANFQTVSTLSVSQSSPCNITWQILAGSPVATRCPKLEGRQEG